MVPSGIPKASILSICWPDLRPAFHSAAIYQIVNIRLVNHQILRFKTLPDSGLRLLPGAVSTITAGILRRSPVRVRDALHVRDSGPGHDRDRENDRGPSRDQPGMPEPRNTQAAPNIPRPTL